MEEREKKHPIFFGQLELMRKNCLTLKRGSDPYYIAKHCGAIEDMTRHLIKNNDIHCLLVALFVHLNRDERDKKAYVEERRNLHSLIVYEVSSSSLSSSVPSNIKEYEYLCTH